MIPADTADASPRFAVSCFSSAWDIGDYEGPGNPPNGDAAFTDSAVLEFGDGQPNAPGAEPGHTVRASLGTNGSTGGGIGLGATYGLAFASGLNPNSIHYPNSRLYAAAFTKRLTRYGPGGPGAIYLLDRVTNSERLYVQIPGVVPGPGGAPGSPGDGSTATFPNGQTAATYTPGLGGIHTLQHDYGVLPYVSRSGIGDLDIDPQERFLYGVNLRNRAVFRIDTWSANPQSTLTYLPWHSIMAAPDSCNASGMSGPQDVQPFGLHITADSLYLGIVCSAASGRSRADLAAGVLRYDLASSTWSPGFVLGTLMPAYDAERQEFIWDARWNPWQDTLPPPQTNIIVHPMPILSDLEIDQSGDMVLAFRDRLGDLATTPRLPNEYGQAQGDLLLAPRIGPYSWSSPSSAEHFNDDMTNPNIGHIEQTWGAVAYVPGMHSGSPGGEIVTTLHTPYRLHSGGIAWFDTTGGAPTTLEEIYNGYEAGFNPTIYSKAQGLGDMELLCDWRAVGDRVWRDTNGDGRQDAGEPGANGVLVNLRDSAGNVVAQVTTGNIGAGDGWYAFFVHPFQTYTVQIDPANFSPGGPLAGFRATAMDAGADDADSDANASGQIAVPAAPNRDLNLTFDAGFTTGANVHIQKGGPATAPLGSSFTYTITYANDGPLSATNVQVADTLPLGLTFLSANPPPSGVSGQTLTWNLGALAPGALGSLTVTVRVEASALASVANTATIITTTGGDNPGDNTSTTTTTITRPNVRVVKTGPASAPLGSTVTYGLTASNTGNANADNVQLQDTLPVGLSYLSASPPPSGVSNQRLTWNLGTLAPGASVAITVQAQATASAANTVVNTATITTGSPGDDPGDNTSTTTTAILRADVSILKRGPAIVLVGDTISYTLDYRVAGTFTAANTIVTDALPAGLSYLSASPAPATVSGQSLTWNLGDLAPGFSSSISIQARVLPGTASSVTNSAQISTTTGGDDPSNNRSSAITMIQRPELVLQKEGPTAIAAGETLTYTLAYANTGSAPAAVVALTDTLPIGLSYLSASPAPAIAQGATLVWQFGTLAPGASGTIQLVAVADAEPLPAGGASTAQLTNTATLTTPSPGDDPGNNTDTALTVVRWPDLSITKTDGVAQALPGDALTYTLTIRNTGLVTATGVTIRETPPAGSVVLSGGWSQAGGDYTLALGNVGAGSTVTRTFSIQLPQPLDAATVENIAVVTHSRADPTPADTTTTDLDQLLTGQIGDTVWNDADGNKTQGPNEQGLAGVLIQLLDPTTLEVIAAATTDAQGHYQFDGLRLSRYVVQIDPQATLSGSYAGYRLTTDALHPIDLTSGARVDLTADYGLRVIRTTDVTLAWFHTQLISDGLEITWSTTREIGTDYFLVLRGTSPDRAQASVVARVSSQGTTGGQYRVLDPDAGGSAFYWLIEIERDGTEHVLVTISQRLMSTYSIFLPDIRH